MKKATVKILSIFMIISLAVSAQNNDNIVKTFHVKAGENVKVSVDPGNIDIETWNKDEVRIEVISKKKFNFEEFVAEKKGNTIKFHLELEDGWQNSVLVKVLTPSNFNFDLKTTSGNINVQNEIYGNFDAETDGGNVSFDNVNGKVRVSSNGGNISGKNVVGEIKLHTNGGNISLGNVKSGKTEVDTYGGNISVGSVTSDLAAKTHGGNISVGNVGGSANVFTYGGHISMETVSGSAKMETFGGHLNLKGASGKVDAKTMGGHINLEKITGSIDAVTLGGHISAELDPKIKTESFLETSGGNMELKIPSSAKATIYLTLESDEIEKEDADRLVRSDFEATTFNISEDEINATYKLNGGGAKITLKCVGGEVKIKKWSK
jgi:hypothetical protein